MKICITFCHRILHVIHCFVYSQDKKLSRALQIHYVISYLYGHPSVSRDYGFALWMVALVLLQHRVWLARLIRERHCFLHWAQVKSDAGLSPWLWAFLFCLYILFSWASVSLYGERRCCTVCLHAVCSVAVAFQSIWTPFNMDGRTVSVVSIVSLLINVL